MTDEPKRPRGNRTTRRGKGAPLEFELKMEVRCSASQLEVWKQAAEDSGCGNLSEWVRETLDAAVRTKPT